MSTDTRPQSIFADEVLTLAEFSKRTGVCKTGLRALRDQGLRTHRIGRTTFVVGADWLEFVRNAPIVENAPQR